MLDGGGCPFTKPNTTRRAAQSRKTSLGRGDSVLGATVDTQSRVLENPKTPRPALRPVLSLASRGGHVRKKQIQKSQQDFCTLSRLQLATHDASKKSPLQGLQSKMMAALIVGASSKPVYTLRGFAACLGPCPNSTTSTSCGIIKHI